MKEKQSRLLIQHEAMDGYDLDSVRVQCLDNRIHLVAGEYKIAGDSRPATTRPSDSLDVGLMPCPIAEKLSGISRSGR
jgi:hypothetical protein